MKKNLQNKTAFSLIELSIVILIVGIVIAGVTQSSRLINSFKLNTARNVTQSSPVNSISDLALWLESTSEKSFDLADQDDGQQVDNWYDINPQSTSKINLTQATSARQPLYKTASGTINSLPTIKFDGLDTNGDFLQNTANLYSAYTQADQITIFIVHKTNSSSDNSLFFMAIDSGGQYRINFSEPESGSLKFDFGDINNLSASRITVSTPANYINNAKVVTLIRKPTSYGVIRVNGADVLNTAMTSTFANAQLTSSMTFGLGTIFYDLAYSTDMYLGEFIIFRRALKADEVTDVERYLGKKWGITIP